jgi:hypothetical protein
LSKEQFIAKLPGKSFRFLIFNAIGLGIAAATTPTGGIISGLAISAFDNFVLDRILRGWKPNHFINNEIIKRMKRPNR